MADAIKFEIYDALTNAPVTGAEGDCVVSAWRASDLSPRTPPVLTEVSPGLYEVQISDDDRAVGTAILIDTGAGHSPRYKAIAAFKGKAGQFFAWVLTTTGGALWSGAFPTFASWEGTAPAIISPVDGFYVSIPSVADRENDAAGVLIAPPGAIPWRLVFDVAAPGAVPIPPSVTGTTDYAAIEDAILHTVREGLGFAEGRVFWTAQNERPPTKDFAELREVGGVSIGLAENSTRDNPGGAVGEEIVLTSRQVTEIDVDVLVFTRHTVNRGSDLSAAGRVKALRRALEGEVNASVRDSRGIVFVEASKPQPLPRVLETQFEGRATISLKFRVDDRLEETTTYISTTEISWTP